jgi:hypothetical protein
VADLQLINHSPFENYWQHCAWKNRKHPQAPESPENASAAWADHGQKF